MSLLQWNESYSVQVAHIDRQHQTLFNMINELHEALRVGQGKGVVGKVLRRLIEYTESHFKSEEATLEKSGYPELAEHRALHKALVKKVLDFQKNFEAGNTGIAIELMEFLQKWLSEHIQNTDKKYTPFLNGKGVR